MSVLYLHGFASGPESRKARFLRDKLEASGYKMAAPDLADGNFRELTISRQLRVVEQAAVAGARVLIGSSLGGYLAALYASSHPEIERLILLAPAFNFAELWAAALGPERLAKWKTTGSISVFHHAAGRDMELSYKLFEDAGSYESFPDVRQPTLIFHGNADSTVPIEQSRAFVQSHPNAHLVTLQSGHELTDVLDEIWRESENFISAAK